MSNVCPLGGDDCESCPYWPHCRIARDEMWNSYPERQASFMEALTENE